MRTNKGRFKASYDTYRREYFKKRAELEANGLDMPSPIMKRKQWEQTYEATRNDLLGEGKDASHTNREIVNNQAYVMSAKQARALTRAGKRIGLNYNYMQIRTGTEDVSEIYDHADELYKQLRKSGYSGSDAKKIVATEIFGS